MIEKKMEEEINEQINAELYSGYLYLAMSAYFEEQNLSGFARWMRLQAEEEKEHAMRFFDHLVNRGGDIQLDGIDAPPMEWGSPLKAFQDAYAHEQNVTGMINGLVDLAIETGDHASRSMLQWFVDEQVEEEDSTSEIVGKLELIGDEGKALYMLDRELGQRGGAGEEGE